MRDFNGIIKRLICATAVVAVAVLSVSCEDPDFSIGQDLTPDSQQMRVGQLSFDGLNSRGEKYYSTRYYLSEQINTTNQSMGIIGNQRTTEFGVRKNGFYSQFTPVYSLDEDDVFGYLPRLDSVILYYSIATYSGDTTRTVKYNVYEILDDSFLGDYDYEDDDSYIEFTSEQMHEELMKSGVLSELCFDFEFPNQDKEVYLNTGYVTMSNIYDQGMDLVERLFLEREELGYDYTIYDSDNFDEFVEAFKGFYICVAEDQGEYALAESGDDGSSFELYLSSSGWGFYGRSVYEDDPTLVKDTVGMSYIFRDDYVTDAGGLSANVTHFSDRPMTNIKVGDSTDEVETTGTILVEGLGGIVTEVTIEPAIFEEFESVIAESEEQFETLWLNEAKLTIYLVQSTDYVTFPATVTYYDLNRMPSRLGFYTQYDTFRDPDEDYEVTLLTTIADYDYYTEYTYGTESTIGGYLNRSKGCYQLNIPLQLQAMWNDYLEEKEDNDGVVDWDTVDWNKIYLAPVVDNLFSTMYVALQGENDGVNAAPMTLDITYTLIKKN